MKTFVGGFILVAAIATVAGVRWQMLHNTPAQAPSSVRSMAAQQVSTSPQKQFDLSNLPRALELPLVQTPLQPGDLAPDFELPDQNGHIHRLSQLRGQTVVLSFYPRDFTFSCVGEAISFDHSLPAFQIRGANVFSVSVQNVASKALFADRYNISYPLLADTDKVTARNYRVLSKDGVAGRVTFVIGPEGRIQWTDQKVHAQTHATDVLAFLDHRHLATVLPNGHMVPLSRQKVDSMIAQRQASQRFAVNSFSRGF
ncbi:putative peroxiredoxin bcp [Abditibacteriota bacterium]|nr:putative peroxiredoxin bcp [Abditibacteriota bacterium]